MLKHSLGWLRNWTVATSLAMTLQFASASGDAAEPPPDAKPAQAAKLKKIIVAPRADTGTAQAVLVPRADLLHTAQLWPTLSPTIREGDIVGKGDVRKQTEQTVQHLLAVLAESGADLSDLVKLNVYLASSEDAGAVQETLARLLSGKSQPAVTYVSGKLRVTDALVALDGVAAIAANQQPQRGVDRPRGEIFFGSTKLTNAAVLPAGGQVYVSGQASEPAAMPQAVKGTLDSLKQTLDHLGLSLSQVVQVKSFMLPISSAPVVEKQIAEFFGKSVPPLVFVEWDSNLPIEIELVVADKPAGEGAAEAPSIEFITPPHLKPSPIFCRVTRTRGDQTIYIGGLYGTPGADNEKQVHDIFAELKKLLAETGSDLRHLAKATYYVANDEVSAKLGRIRPEFYDPNRPPAASKAKVRGVGASGRTITLDMIAVPAGETK